MSLNTAIYSLYKSDISTTVMFHVFCHNGELCEKKESDIFNVETLGLFFVYPL